MVFHALACTGLVRVEVTVAVSDWHVMHQHRVREFNKSDKTGVDPNSDAGRTKLFDYLVHQRGLNFRLWSPEEVSFFMQVAFPREILRKATVEATQPEFLVHIFHTWKPYLIDWLTLLWDYCGHACEFYGDILYLLPHNQRGEPKDMLRHLFRWLPRRKLYTEWTCVSIACALVPYAKSPSCARVHAEYINNAISVLPPYHVGLVIRSVILGLAQPRDCSCGYKVDEPYCRCIHPDTRRNTALNLDSGQVFAIILLRLVMERIHNIPTFHPDCKPWTVNMRDEMIQSACEHVFTQPTYIIVYRTVTRATSTPTAPLKFPRRTFDGSKQVDPHDEHFLFHEENKEDAEEFRNRQLDFDNSAAQTGGCVVASCKQQAKDGCANVACKTHCQDFFFVCHVHRNYPDPKEYQPRKNIGTVISSQGNKRKLEPRDTSTI